MDVPIDLLMLVVIPANANSHYWMIKKILVFFDCGEGKCLELIQ